LKNILNQRSETSKSIFLAPISTASNTSGGGGNDESDYIATIMDLEYFGDWNASPSMNRTVDENINSDVI
jgi:hypothetical protein